ncbi:MAG: hypothetical protein KBT27_09015 [Prevotellaceae bacterium]|nr:hypothetical protein [Candidatus Faecinaster equi]
MSIYEQILEEEYENKVNSSENINPDIDEERPLVDVNNIDNSSMLFF